MSLGHNTSIVRDGLVFYYDMENTKKSWKGKPNHNYIPNGHFANGLGVTSEYGSNATNQVIYMPYNPGHSSYVLAQSGVSSSEYEIHFKSGYSIQPNTTYCMSAWVSKSTDYNGNYAIFHSRYYQTDGGNYATSGEGVVYETKVINGVEWQRRYMSFTTNSLCNGVWEWYFGYGNGVSVGYMYATDIQMELGSFPSPYINDYRSSTQAILDLTKNNTITPVDLTYNSDGSFEFDGSNDCVYFNNPVLSSSPYTILQFVKPDNLPNVAYQNTTDIHTTIRGATNWSPGIWATQTTIRSHGKTQYADNNINWSDLRPSLIGMVFDGSTVKNIFDGMIQTPTNITSYAPTDQTVLYIGKDNSTTGREWDGKIYTTLIYNRALTADEVNKIFNAMRGRYGL